MPNKIVQNFLSLRSGGRLKDLRRFRFKEKTRFHRVNEPPREKTGTIWSFFRKARAARQFDSLFDTVEILLIGNDDVIKTLRDAPVFFIRFPVYLQRIQRREKAAGFPDVLFDLNA